MKRFYTAVDATQTDKGWQVALDGRPIRTVGGAPQTVPGSDLAQALAGEWESQGETLDPKTMPLRDMVDYAIDVVAADRMTIIDNVLAYGDTDTLLYRADPDEPLHTRQLDIWEPIVTSFEAEHDVNLVRVSGIVHRPQSPETFAVLRAKLEQLNAFELAAIQAMASLAASLVVALSVTDRSTAQSLWQAACLEEQWQADQWGHDEEAEERRLKRTADFLKACEMRIFARS